MRILFGISTTVSFKNPILGASRVVLSLAQALADRGHTIDVDNALVGPPDWNNGYDIVHLFNANGDKGPYRLLTQLARLQNIPVLLTPTYWSVDELDEEIVRVLGEEHKINFQYFLKKRRPFFQEVDMLLPNSEGEAEKLKELCEGDIPPHKAVPNAVDIEREIGPVMREEITLPEKLSDQLKDRFVLCVGRMEVRKNIHGLIEAMDILWKKDPDLQLVLLGKRSLSYFRHMQDNKYFEDKNILIGDVMPPQAAQALMKRANAHALFSFVETPGLVNLEAASLGTPIAVADRGSVREYFGDDAFYGDPTSPESMANAIEEALNADGEKTADLAVKIWEKYNYELAADLVEKAYEDLL